MQEQQNIQTGFTTWLSELDSTLGIKVERLQELHRWKLNGGRLDDPKYPVTTVQFVAETKILDGPSEGERPLIWCNTRVHSDMIGLCTSIDGRSYFLGMAKSEAGHVHFEVYPNVSDHFRRRWSVTCAHQFTPRPTNPFAWLSDSQECKRRGLTVIAEPQPTFADPGMLMKKYNIGLVFAPPAMMEGLVMEAKEAKWNTRWLSFAEMDYLRDAGRTTEFLFTTAGLLAGRTIERALEDVRQR